MIPFFNGPPPSKLGFVAKPEMPPHINILFRARPPLDYVEPEETEHKTKYDFIHGGNIDLDKLFEDGPPPERICQETPAERKERIWKERVIEHYKKVKELRKNYDPKADKNATSDPRKTLFVSRLSYKTDEETLRREFERFGPINSLRLVRDKKTGKSRGYAFVEFKHSRHCDRLYDASGMKIDGKRILVDYEEGRVKIDWLPKRLGGGKGRGRGDRDTERKIRKVIKEYKRSERSRSQSKRSESRRSESKRREHSKAEREPETTHKRQKVSEEREVSKNETKRDIKEDSKKESRFESKDQVSEKVKENINPEPEHKNGTNHREAPPVHNEHPVITKETPQMQPPPPPVEQLVQVQSEPQVAKNEKEVREISKEVPKEAPKELQKEEEREKPREVVEAPKESRRDIKDQSKAVEDQRASKYEPTKDERSRTNGRDAKDSRYPEDVEMKRRESKDKYRDKDRERDRDRDRHRDKDRDRPRERSKDRDRSKDRSRDRDRSKDRDRHHKDKKDKRDKKDKKSKKHHHKDKKKHKKHKSRREGSYEKEEGEFHAD